MFHNRPKGVDWSDHEFPSVLNVADIACGTGTLLMAVAAEVERRHTDVTVRLKPKKSSIRVALDNLVSSTGQALNIHRTASLYRPFPRPKPAAS